MPEPEVVVKPGKVKSYNPERAQGQVEVGGKTLPFDLTCFHSGRPTRPPEKGEKVEVLFSGPNKDLLGVRR